MVGSLFSHESEKWLYRGRHHCQTLMHQRNNMGTKDRSAAPTPTPSDPVLPRLLPLLLHPPGASVVPLVSCLLHSSLATQPVSQGNWAGRMRCPLGCPALGAGPRHPAVLGVGGGGLTDSAPTGLFSGAGARRVSLFVPSVCWVLSGKTPSDLLPNCRPSKCCSDVSSLKPACPQPPPTALPQLLVTMVPCLPHLRCVRLWKK